MMGDIVVMIVELLIFFILLAYGLKHCNFEDRQKKTILIVTCLGSAVLIVLDCLVYRTQSYYDNITDLAISNEIMLAMPYAGEKMNRTLRFSISVFLLNIAIKIFHYFGWTLFGFDRLIIIILLNSVLVGAYIIMISIAKFSSLRKLFGSQLVWCNVQEYLRFLYVIAFLFIAIFCFCSGSVNGMAKWIMMIFSGMMFMSMFMFLYIRAAMDNVFMLSRSFSEKVHMMADEESNAAERDDDNRKMNDLYKRVINIMAEKKPFLNGDFDMDELAQIMFSNKLYLSKTINIMSGKNFRQFVNGYRVSYAIDLMKKDPRMKLLSVAEMSGFHSTATFNMAFKLNTGSTPTEWMNEYLNALP